MIPLTVQIWPNRLILGRGSVGGLAAVLRDLGATRALVVCGKTVASGPLLQNVTSALGPLCGGVFDGVASHTPLPMLRQSLAMVDATGADAIVSVGGGSAIDAGKGTALLRAANGQLAPYAIRRDSAGAMAHARLSGAPLIHVAIPTTTGSASEVMPTAGLRDVERRQKLLFWDDALIPQAVILDPEMTVHTGPMLTAASGMTAVARCIEALYSVNRNPLAEGLALHALRLLYRNLPLTTTDPGNLDARFECQVACSMSGIAAINSMVSVVHAIGHIVGGRYALQHGVSHSILLAPAMRRLLGVIGDRQRFVLEAMEGGTAGSADDAGAAAADRMAALVARLPLKQRLRDLGIPAEDLAEIAAQAPHDYMMANLPVPLAANDIEALLRQVW